jgi:Sedlin, N-terminal conserved region
MLLGIAVLGKSNEPLYLRNCRPSAGVAQASDGDENSSNNSSNKNDPLGLSSMTRPVHASLPLDDQIVIHAALDSFEEKVDRTVTGQMPMVKKQTSSALPHWVGLLLTRGRSTVYGYVTATNVKIFALVESHNKKTNVKEIQDFMKNVHMYYIEYIMNPFCPTKGGIKSTTFDEKIRSATEKLYRKSEIMV